LEEITDELSTDGNGLFLSTEVNLDTQTPRMSLAKQNIYCIPFRQNTMPVLRIAIYNSRVLSLVLLFLLLHLSLSMVV